MAEEDINLFLYYINKVCKQVSQGWCGCPMITRLQSVFSFCHSQNLPSTSGCNMAASHKSYHSHFSQWGGGKAKKGVIPPSMDTSYTLYVILVYSGSLINVFLYPPCILQGTLYMMFHLFLKTTLILSLFYR